MRNLMEKYLGRNVFWAPDNPGGGQGDSGGNGSGGNNGGAGGNGDGAENDSDAPEFDDDDDGALPDDAIEILAGFGEIEEDAIDIDDTKPPEAGPGPIPQEQVTAMETEMRAAIKKMKLPDAAIPADFDINDKTQLKTLLDNTIQATVSQVLQVVYKPTQLAMTHAVNSMQKQMKSEIAAAQLSSNARNVISEIPGYNDPKVRPMIDSMNEALKAKGRKPTERSTLIRKMLKQMSITPAANGTGNRSSSATEPTPQIRTGKAALDNFFPKF